MAGEALVTIQGNLGGDAELRTTPNGKFVTSFSVAVTPRNWDKTKEDFVDGETLWFRCFVWGKNATGAANELRTGTRVTVFGELTTNSYVDKTGVERKQLEINVRHYGIVPRNVAEPQTVTNEKPIEDPVDDPWF